MAKRKTTIKVTVCKIGQEDKTVRLEAGATFQEVLDASGHGSEESFLVDGKEMDLDDEASDGDEVWVSSKVKGN